MADLTTIYTILGAASSGAVVMSAIFVLIQLRQNGRLLRATLRQQQATFSLTFLERITDESFPRRRARMFVLLQKFRETGWKDVFETPEDFEVRNFAYFYELLGQMARSEIVDLETVLDSLQFIVVRDWQVFEPHAAFIASRYDLDVKTYRNFEWLAVEARLHMAHRSEEEKAGTYQGFTHEPKGPAPGGIGARGAPPSSGGEPFK
ncbi:MAG: hypothetical protein L3K18_01245 [Thermoplasmata archaeon]|nr:hypothetical protein [Thermoplasmata archaeon]MCI4355754.1 hypothetical protein [Thermoplasmata archaeon]